MELYDLDRYHRDLEIVGELEKTSLLSNSGEALLARENIFRKLFKHAPLLPAPKHITQFLLREYMFALERIHVHGVAMEEKCNQQTPVILIPYEVNDGEEICVPSERLRV